MRTASWLATACLFCAATAHAHEHWVITDTGANTNGRQKVCICSGHSFPQSDILLAERLLADMQIVGPSGEPTPYKPAAQEKTWMADVSFDKPGVWMVSFSLKKPQEDHPVYQGRCLMVMGGQDDPTRYASGKGLEIVPGALLSELKPGGTLPVSILMDGTPVEGKIAVTPEKGAASFLSTGRDRPAQLRIPSAGAYLLTASQKGTTFSLTFSVAATSTVGSP